GVEKGRRGGAEAAALVEAVERNDLVFALLLLVEEEAHGDAHPEELGRLEAAGGFHRLVDDEVTIVEGLDAEEVELEVGGRVELRGERIEIVFEEARAVALDRDAVLDGLAEGVDVELLQLGDAVADDVPA